MKKWIDSSVYWLIGFTVLHVALKLFGIIDKSWLLVTSPLWVPFSMFLFWDTIYFVFMKPFKKQEDGSDN